MDFVVVGFGVGALGILLGVILGGPLAARGERAALRATDPGAAAYDVASAAEYRGAGQAFLGGGGAVVLATVGGLAGGLDDRGGALLVATTATVAALGIIFWGYHYRSRNPLPPRPRRHRPRDAHPSAALASADPVGPAVLAREPIAAAVRSAIEPGATPPPDQASRVGSRNDDGDAEVAPAAKTDAATSVYESESESDSDDFGPRPLEVPARPMDADAAFRPEVETASNGRVAGEAVAVEEPGIPAFVARGAPRDAEESAVHEDDDRANER